MHQKVEIHFICLNTSFISLDFQLDCTGEERRDISLTAISMLSTVKHSNSSAETLAGTSLQKMVGLIQLFLASV